MNHRTAEKPARIEGVKIETEVKIGESFLRLTGHIVGHPPIVENLGQSIVLQYRVKPLDGPSAEQGKLHQCGSTAA